MFGLSYLKLALYGGIALVLMSIGAGVTYKIMDKTMVAPLKAEVKSAQTTVESCNDANGRNAKTIIDLQSEIYNLKSSYEKRLKGKDISINKITALCNLTPVKKGVDGNDKKDNSGDSMLDDLNGMYPKATDSTN